MLQYLIIQLDDTSVSYCHYENLKENSKLIGLDNLKAGILFAMKENLMIQFIYPNYELPHEYKGLINSIDHNKIVPSQCRDKSLLSSADVVVFDGWVGFNLYRFKKEGIYLIRTTKKDFFENFHFLQNPLAIATRINVVITDIDTFTSDDLDKYKNVLTEFSNEIISLYLKGTFPQLNLLTDRITLDNMNNCNAGWENVTLAPDGKFYVCPAFYIASDDEDYGLGKSKSSIGSPKTGLDIKNHQLYKLSHAPLCRKCDAYQCKRCVWLNRKTTYEINTPSHEQCAVAHVERNISRRILLAMRKKEILLPEREIKEINYIDPFDVYFN